MEVYVGLFLIAIGMGYLIVRFFQMRKGQSSIVKDKSVTRPFRPRSQKRKQQGLLNLSQKRLQDKQVKRKLRSKRSTPVTGTVHKPWGW